MRDTLVYAELTAFEIMRKIEGWGMCTDEKRTPHDAGNKIIELAEQIKAERAVAAMQA